MAGGERGGGEDEARSATRAKGWEVAAARRREGESGARGSCGVRRGRAVDLLARAAWRRRAVRGEAAGGRRLQRANDLEVPAPDEARVELCREARVVENHRRRRAAARHLELGAVALNAEQLARHAHHAAAVLARVVVGGVDSGRGRHSGMWAQRGWCSRPRPGKKIHKAKLKKILTCGIGSFFFRRFHTSRARDDEHVSPCGPTLRPPSRRRTIERHSS